MEVLANALLKYKPWNPARSLKHAGPRDYPELTGCPVFLLILPFLILLSFVFVCDSIYDYRLVLLVDSALPNHIQTK